MLLRLILLFTLLPVVELYLLIRVGSFIWAGWTILVVLGTGVLGAWLARQEGLRVVQRVQADLQAGHLPADALIDGLLILIAGVVLLTPGFLTDAAGFTLLSPPGRAVVRRALTAAFHRSVQQHGGETVITVDGWREP